MPRRQGRATFSKPMKTKTKKPEILRLFELARLIDQRVLPGNRRTHEVCLSDLGVMVMRTHNLAAA